MKTFLTLIASIFLAAIVNAQTPEEKAMIVYMSSSETHLFLAKYDGEWHVNVPFWNAPDQPPISAEGSCTNTMILGGRYQQSETKGDILGLPFQGIGIMGYNNATQKIVATFIDNMGTGMIQSEGTFDTKSNIISRKGTSTDPVTGKQVEMKEITTFVSDDQYILEAFMIVNGAAFKSMESTYTRKK